MGRAIFGRPKINDVSFFFLLEMFILINLFINPKGVAQFHNFGNAYTVNPFVLNTVGADLFYQVCMTSY